MASLRLQLDDQEILLLPLWLEESIQHKEYFSLGVKNVQAGQDEEKFVAKRQKNQMEKEEETRNMQKYILQHFAQETTLV
jgi:hypothetical protein